MDWGCHRSSVPRCCCQSIPWGWDVWGSPSDASDCCRVTLPHLQRQILWSIQFFFRLWDRHPCARARKWAVTYRLPLGIFQPAVKIADKKKEMFVNACSRHFSCSGVAFGEWNECVIPNIILSFPRDVTWRVFPGCLCWAVRTVAGST